MPKARLPFTAAGPSNEQEKHMSFRSWIREHVVDDNPDQTEKSRLDRLDDAKDGAK